jgi:hypothetical protein
LVDIFIVITSLPPLHALLFAFRSSFFALLLALSFVLLDIQPSGIDVSKVLGTGRGQLGNPTLFSSALEQDLDRCDRERLE